MATKASNNKKRVVVSFRNLSPELQEELKKKYPTGYTESMIRIDKPGGDFFYAVVLETEDTIYLVKIDVKIDDGSVDDEEDKDFYEEDDIKGADEIVDNGSMDGDEE